MIITSYENPDLDGVACIVAYSEFLNSKGSNARSFITGVPHPEAEWALRQTKVKIPTLNSETDDEVVIVDVSTPVALSNFINIEKVIEVIDHRKISRAEEFPNAKKQIELVGAAATLIAEKFFYKKLKPRKSTAMLLYGAIASNTLNFKANVVTSRDLKMAKWLRTIGEISNDFTHDMFLAKSNFGKRSMKEVILADLSRSTKIGDKEIAIAQLEIIGVKNLFASRHQEIYDALVEIKKDLKADMIFLSAVDLESGFNGFVYTNEDEKNLIMSTLGAREEGNYLIRDGVILRKEIQPILAEFV